tara:strand:- start:98 stop:769 length:672 start_codon:yes stop_codon:yes gene_type:complete
MNNFSSVSKFLKTYKKLFLDEIIIPQQAVLKNKQRNFTNKKDSLILYECIINNCEKCQPSDLKSNFFFGSGDANADLLIVDEAPALETNDQGVTYLGKAAKLLDKILLAVDLTRTKNIFIVNILKCKPPRNRDPLRSEIDKYIPYLNRQIKIIQPKLILALGKVVGKSLIKRDISLQQMRNKIFDYNGIPLRITYHPETLLRNQNLKKLVWDDFKWVKSQMEN